MSLLVLMYHRAGPGPDGNSPRMLDDHFGHIAEHYGCVLPGEALTRGRLNVCLSFDDGYYDFYAIVQPLLRKHGLRALLAVSPGRIPERTEAAGMARLLAAAESGGYCTWPELRELANSGQVRLAAHGFNHRRLDDPTADLRTEIASAQAQLYARLGRSVDSFVFPFGRISTPARWEVRKSYRYGFRIGGADNRSWGQELLYRVPADGLSLPDQPFAPTRLALYRARRYWNRLRGR